MNRAVIDELKTFYINAKNLKFKSLLFIIMILIILPFFFYAKINTGLMLDFNNTFRYAIIYLINIYHLILIYNNKIYDLDNNIDDEFANNEIYQPRAIDIIRRFINQAGLNLDGLIDIEIIQIEPENHGGVIPLPNQVDARINDNQNVHDTSIQSHINMAIKTLKKCKHNLNLTETEVIHSIRTFILNKSTASDDVKDRALVSLKKIKKINGIITRLNITEMEILFLVWNRISDPINADIMHTLKDNLILELADCMIDDDNIHCVQGRATRILQTLENADAEGILNLKPLWVIKEEIATIFGKYTQILNKKLDSIPHMKKIYNKINPSEDEMPIITKINDKLKKGIDNHLRKLYVDKEIINLQQYISLTKDYFNAI